MSTPIARPLLLAAMTLVALSGCADPDAPPHGPSPLAAGDLRVVETDLSAAERTARYVQIRDAAAGRGIDHTAFLLGGIAHAETNLAHCWSEATWACQGPNSADCGGGPVIAGAADGPCSSQQGGLGMFQFDAGTYTDTLNTYSSDVLTVAGNVSHALDFVVNMVRRSTYTTNAATNEQALQWVINFDINNATLRDQWIKTVTRYYNGCQPTSSCWNQRYSHYNSSLQTVIDETGLPFWQVATTPVDRQPTGWLDAVGCESIGGWAQDPDAPEQPIDVHVYFGGASGSGAPGTPVRADIARDDLCGAIGSCDHGFVTLSPLSLFDGNAHPIHAYGISVPGPNNAELSGSPHDLTCPPTLPDGVRRHVVNPDSLAAWALDTFNDRLPVSEAAAAAVPVGDDLPATPTLVRADDGTPEVWVLDGPWRRHVPSGAVMAAWRFDWAAIQLRPAAEVYALAVGPTWRPRPVRVDAEGAVWVIDAPAPVDNANNGEEPDAGGQGDDAGVGGEDAGVPGDDRKDVGGPGGADADPVDGVNQTLPPPIVKDACAAAAPAGQPTVMGGLLLAVAVVLGLALRR